MSSTKRGSNSSKSSTTESKASKNNMERNDDCERIAAIDKQLVELLDRRARLVQNLEENVGSNDSTQNLWKWQLVAEKQVSHLPKDTPLDSKVVSDWLRHTVSASYQPLACQTRIAYLGPQYSYSYLAAIRHFGEASNLVPVATIGAVFQELLRDQSKFGVVPIENSTDGRVVDTLGMFARFPVHICGEVLLPIHHCLLGRCSRTEVTEVHSKPQALSQCRTWLAQHLPEARLVEITSTAAAAKLAAERPGVAAIASREAGVHHGLQVIDANIEDNANNVTRFVILGGSPAEPTGKDKTAIMFQVPHQPGALADAMLVFRKNKLNLTWIESFPIEGSRSEYLFFIELEGHQQRPAIKQALKQLQKQALRLEVLGSYPKDQSLGA
jgi:chorismate mutase / prephenate dehydratase